MTNDSQQQPKKRSLGLTIALAVLALAIFMVVGKALSYFGILLGVLAAGGGAYMFLKGPPEKKKLAGIGVGVGIGLIIFGNMGASESREKAAAATASAEAAKMKAEVEKARFEKLVADLAALPATATSSQMSSLCSDIAKSGGIPAAHSSRCGDAFLSEGQAALTSKRAADAVPLLEQAAKLTTKKDEVNAALTDAKVALAVESGTSEATRAEKALEENDLPKAAKVAKGASETVASAQKLKPEDAALKEVAARLDAVLVKADPERRAAAEKAAFDAMGPAEHLAAAKAAMAEGYDPKSRTGGALNGAEEHLNAIPAEAKEAKEAKALLAEVAARRERANTLSRIGAVVREADKDATFEVAQGRLVVTVQNASFGTKKDIVAGAYMDLGTIAQKWDELPSIQSITVIEMGTYEDTRGNEQKLKVGEYTVSRAKAKGINWSKIRTENILKVIDKAYVAPGIGGITVD